jgi:hypothetical protein
MNVNSVIIEPPKTKRKQRKWKSGSIANSAMPIQFTEKLSKPWEVSYIG